MKTNAVSFAKTNAVSFAKTNAVSFAKILTRRRTSAPSTQQGVVIIEVMVAILIFSIGVLGIVGMQANMVKNTSESKYRADAAYIAQRKIGELWTTAPDKLPADGSITTEPISAQMIPNGSLSIQRDRDRYTVTVTWQQPGEARHEYTTVATISGA